MQLRVFSGDLFILTEVFFDECYRLPEEILLNITAPTPLRILDLGANIGLSTTYFLARHPSAEVFCVEPDPGNFKLLELNITFFQPRARLLRAAVSDRAGTGLILPASAAHSVTVQRVETESLPEGSSQLMTIAQILEICGWDFVDVIKMDIEGHEWPVFDTDLDWLSNCRCLLCEFHGQRDPNQLVQKIDALGFKVLPPENGTQWCFIRK